MEGFTGRAADAELVERLSQHNQRRIDSRNSAYAGLLPHLLSVARDKNSHWRYVLTASVRAVFQSAFSCKANRRVAILAFLESLDPARSAAPTRPLCISFRSSYLRAPQATWSGYYQSYKDTSFHQVAHIYPHTGGSATPSEPESPQAKG